MSGDALVDEPGPEDLSPLLERVRRVTGHDFGGYKRGTLGRRVRRRMTTLEVPSLDAYLARLDADPDECGALVRELLISVTSFFREPAALTAAIDALPAPPAGRPLRVWVPGCATGEEAYSLAIALRARWPGPVQIFATDIDHAALERARAGRYPEPALAGLPAGVRDRYFTDGAHGAVVVPELRDLCVFSPHDLLQDPPFARLHLVSCRNLLIYLEAEQQRRVLSMFHYALEPGGVLLLGEAESAAVEPTLFEPAHPEYRLYRRRDQPTGVGWISPTPVARPLPALRVPPPSPSTATTRLIERALLDQHTPASAVVTEAGEVVYVCGRAERFLEAPQGSAPFDLFALVRPALRQALRAALALTIASSEAVTSPDVLLPDDDGTRVVRAHVRPMTELGAGARLLLVTFTEVPTVDAPPTRPTAPEPAVEALERELATLRAQWRASLHELESANARLRASGEATIALNEELQSSQEEVQSANEELRVVNTDLQRKVEALDAAQATLEYMFAATRLAAVLVGPDLRIRRFSPTASEIVRVIASDIGRPLTDLTMRVEVPELPRRVAEVLVTGEIHEARVIRDDGARYLMRIAPFLTLTGHVDGAALSFVDITAIEQARDDARRHAAELATLLDVMPAAVFVTRKVDAGQIDGNREAARLLGYTPGGPVPLPGTTAGAVPIRHRGVPLTHDRLAIVRAARGESVRGFEVDLTRADGRVVHLLGHAEPLRDPAGAPRGAVAAFIDVTAIRETEQALRMSEARLRALTDTAIDFITRYDRELRLIYVNPAVERALGRDRAELLGRRVDEAGGLADWNVHLRQVFATGQPMRFTYRGSTGLSYDVQLSPEHDGPAVVSVVAVSRDVTETVRARDALRASEARYAAIIANAPITIAMLRAADGRFVAINPAFERTFGWTAAEVIGRTSREIGIGGEHSQAEVAEALAGGGVVRDFECDRPTRSGELRRLSVNTQLVELDGETLILTCALDITERVAAEAARNRLQAELAQAQKLEAIGTLAGGIAHDFNNLLGGVEGGLTLLEAEVPASARGLVDDLHALVKRGSDLARQLLGFARRGQYDVRPLDLAQVIASTLKMFAPTRRDVSIGVTVAPGMRAVLMDHTQLEQVLLNLLVNAGQAMPEGGRIDIVASDDAPGGRFVTLQVRDTGVGMDDATRQRVFEPFFTTKRPGQGTGLGLASVYGIVTHHGGTIEVTSRPGHGTTFTLELPATAARPAAAAAPLVGAAPGQGTVLLVDDEPKLVDMYRRLLERLGYQVLTATDGLSGVAQVRAHRDAIAVCILDLTMPGISASRTFDLMRAERPDLKVLIASGFSPEGDARTLLARGCVGFLQKPFTVAELRDKLRELLAE